jgi:hypothetical protein
MAGMRDKLIHDYFRIDLEILWKTVKGDVPSLKPLIQSMLEDLEKWSTRHAFEWNSLSCSGSLGWLFAVGAV